MKKLIIGISGVVVTPSGRRVGTNGSGKDATADVLVKDHGFQKVSLADPLKRICKNVFDFTDEQLWGPSQMRNQKDMRYRRGAHEFIDSKYGVTKSVCRVCGESGLTDIDCYLTPRFALQTLGTEWGRGCFSDTWVNLAMRHSLSLLSSVCIPDVRFKNELRHIRKSGGILIRVVRPIDREADSFAHPSELEAMQIPDDEFNSVLQNYGTLNDLVYRVNALVTSLQ